jgi:hypothetical protein
LQPAAPFARWSAVLAAELGCLTLAVVVATFPLASMTGQLDSSAVATTLVGLVFAAVGLLVGLAVLLFPDGRLPSPRLRWILRVYLAIGAIWVGGAVAITIGAIAAGHVRVDATGNLVSLDSPHGNTEWWGIVQIVFFILLIAVTIGSLTGQVVRFRLSTGERRQQLKWLLSGTAAAMPGLGVSIALGDAIVAAFAGRLQDAADPDKATADLGLTAQQALEPAHLSLWTAEVAS